MSILNRLTTFSAAIFTVAIVASCGLAASARPARLAKSVKTAQVSPAYSRRDEVAWHIKQGAQYQSQGDSARAFAELREALRLDPANSAARDLIVKLTRDEVALHIENGTTDRDHGDTAGALAELEAALRLDPTNADVINQMNDLQTDGAKQALQRLTDVVNGSMSLDALADSLDDRTADEVAQKALVKLLRCVETADGHSVTHDNGFEDDMEAFVDTHNLGQTVETNQRGLLAPYSTDRMYGREFLKAMSAFVKRAYDSRIVVTGKAPYILLDLRGNIAECTYKSISPGMVEITLPDATAPPLVAELEGNAWRIGAWPGFHLEFLFSTGIHPHPW